MFWLFDLMTRLLLLDEPCEGLSPALGEKLAGTIQELQRANSSVLSAASDVKGLSFAETVYTLERGAIVQA